MINPLLARERAVTAGSGTRGLIKHRMLGLATLGQGTRKVTHFQLLKSDDSASVLIIGSADVCGAFQLTGSRGLRGGYLGF
jgi:hypothetical protein